VYLTRGTLAADSRMMPEVQDAAVTDRDSHAQSNRRTDTITGYMTRKRCFSAVATLILALVPALLPGCGSDGNRA
jgi:hypothetical protein